MGSEMCIRDSIVGLKVDNEALKEEYRRWAEIGGGQYIDVEANPAELADALRTAMTVSYTVENANGEMVGIGVVGDDPLTLPAGRYTLKIGSAEREIVVQGDSLLVIDLSE